MSEEAFVRAVLDEPDEDAPRLVMADWYEENGRPERAAFVRLQVEQARLHPADPHHRELKAQATQLLKAHQDRWLAPLRQALDRPKPRQLLRFGFRRGLLESVRLQSRRKDFLCAARAALARHPILELGLSADDPPATDAALAELAGVPELHGLRRLRLHGEPPSAAGLRDLGASAHLRRLEGLAVGWMLPASSLAALGGTPLAQRLTSFKAHLGSGEPAAFLEQLDAPLFPALASLHLESGRLGGGLLGGLARCLHLAGLRELTVRDHGEENRGLGELLASPLWGRLTRLWLDHHRIDDAAAFAAAVPTSRLAALGLSWCGGTAGFVAELLALPSWGPLRGLELSGADLGGAGVALAGSPHVAGLTRLCLYRCQFGNEAARALAESPHAGNLREVRLGGVRFSPGPRRALLRRFGDALSFGP